MLNFGLIADDPSVLVLLDAFQADLQAEIVQFWVPNAALGETALGESVQKKIPYAQHLKNWDAFLAGKTPDAVIVAGTSEAVQIAADQLNKSGVPLLVFTDVAAGPAALYSANSRWPECQQKRYPLFVSGMDKGSQESHQAFLHQQVGKLWKVDFVREVPEFDVVLRDRLLLQDLSWLRQFNIRPTHVTMHQSGGDDAHPVEVAVLLTSSEAPEIRWTLKRSEFSQKSCLKLQGECGEQTSEWLISSDNKSDQHSRVVGELREQLQQLIQSNFSTALHGEWKEILSLGEIGAAANRSWQRRRTVEIFYEESSERTQFKSQMTALGCGTLLWTMFGMVSLLTFAGIFDPRDREYRAASASGFVLVEQDFENQSPQLTDSGKEKLIRIAQEWSSSSPVLVIDSTSTDEPLSQKRFAVVEQSLLNQGVPEPQPRIAVRAITGRWFETLLWVGWGIVFLPLGITLLLQLLIFAASPSKSED